MHDFPTRPIRIVTAGVGSDTDIVTRLIAQGISGPLRQPVIVENQGGTLSAETVSKAPPDGHTLIVTGGNLWYGPLLIDTSYDPMRDFSPITLAATSPLIVVVHPSLAANSIEELIALAKARPGELNYGSGSNGSSSQLAGALFIHLAGIDIVRASYGSGGLLAVNDLIAGKVQLMIPSAGSAMPQVKAGRLRALAVTSAQPSVLVPGLPTVAATLPGYEALQIIGIFAPAGTPRTTIHRLNQEIVRFLRTAAVKERLFHEAVEVIGSTPDELAAKGRSEMARWSKLIKDAGIRAN